MARGMRREEHPLTSILVSAEGVINKVYVEMAPTSQQSLVRPRRPFWRAQDGHWAISHKGVPAFLALTGKTYPRFRIWTEAEYKAAGIA